MQTYLAATPRIDAGSPKIVEQAAALTTGCQTDAEKARALYEFVRDSSTPDPVESYTASDILQQGGNLCYQRAILLVALCRAAGIPARLHLQRVSIQGWGNRDIVFAHALVGLCLNSQWHIYEPTGNCLKWMQWTGDPIQAVPFAPDHDCLFDMAQNPRVSGEVLPVFFEDWSDELIAIIEQMNDF